VQLSLPNIVTREREFHLKQKLKDSSNSEISNSTIEKRVKNLILLEVNSLSKVVPFQMKMHQQK
jgi:hypothetical protein